MTTDLRTLYGEYIDAINDRRLGDMDKFFHDEMTFNDRPVRREDHVAEIAGHLDCVPDYHWHVEDLIIEGDHVGVRLVDHGTPAKEWLGLQPTGRRVELTEYAFYHFKDGRVHMQWYLLDRESVRRQLEGGDK